MRRRVRRPAATVLPAPYVPRSFPPHYRVCLGTYARAHIDVIDFDGSSKLCPVAAPRVCPRDALFVVAVARGKPDKIIDRRAAAAAFNACVSGSIVCARARSPSVLSRVSRTASSGKSRNKRGFSLALAIERARFFHHYTAYADSLAGGFSPSFAASSSPGDDATIAIINDATRLLHRTAFVKMPRRSDRRQSKYWGEARRVAPLRASVHKIWPRTDGR